MALEFVREVHGIAECSSRSGWCLRPAFFHIASCLFLECIEFEPCWKRISSRYPWCSRRWIVVTRNTYNTLLSSSNIHISDSTLSLSLRRSLRVPRHMCSLETVICAVNLSDKQHPWKHWKHPQKLAKRWSWHPENYRSHPFVNPNLDPVSKYTPPFS